MASRMLSWVWFACLLYVNLAIVFPFFHAGSVLLAGFGFVLLFPYVVTDEFRRKRDESTSQKKDAKDSIRFALIVAACVWTVIAASYPEFVYSYEALDSAIESIIWDKLSNFR